MKRTQQEILELYEKYYEMVWRICLVRFGNSHDAYDAAQETFVRLMNYTKPFHSGEHEKAWLIRTAVNYYKDVMKSGRRRNEICLDAGKPPEAGVVPDEYSEVYEAMMELPEKYRVILKKNRIIDGQTFLRENVNNADRDLQFRVNDESGKETISANMEYFTGEMAEDGGYLIGIRYNFNVEKKLEQTQQLILSLENAGDIEGKLKVRLPESGDVTCVRFTSENKPENSIIISPLGMTLTVTDDKIEGSENTFNHGLLDRMKLVMSGQAKTVSDFGEGYSTSTLVGDTQTAYTWYVQKEFTNLVDVSEISYIELDGEKYSK